MRALRVEHDEWYPLRVANLRPGIRAEIRAPPCCGSTTNGCNKKMIET